MGSCWALASRWPACPFWPACPSPAAPCPLPALPPGWRCRRERRSHMPRPRAAPLLLPSQSATPPTRSRRGCGSSCWWRGWSWRRWAATSRWGGVWVVVWGLGYCLCLVVMSSQGSCVEGMGVPACGPGNTCQSLPHAPPASPLLPNSPPGLPLFLPWQVVEVAAVTGQGLLELEEALLLQADLMELRASRSRRAEAVVIEAKVDKGQGPVATVVVKRGTLRVGARLVARRACLLPPAAPGCCRWTERRLQMD